jgi:hypothetical protein
MADEQESFAAMDDDAFEASLTADYEDDADTTPAGEEEDAAGMEEGSANDGELTPDPTEQNEEAADGEEEKPEGWKEEGPGDLKKAVQAKNAELAALKQEAANLRAFQQQVLAERARQEQAQRDAEMQDRLMEMDPVQQTEYLQQERARMQAEQQGAIEHNARVSRWNESFAIARRLDPEFDKKVAHLPAILPQVEQLAFHQTEMSPAEYVLQLAKQFPSPEQRQAEIKAEAEKLAQEVLRKQQDSKQGHKTIARGTSSNAGKLSNKPVRRMNDDEFERHLMS